jgi:hypothetical protein
MTSVTDPEAVERYETRRMLLAFKASLPSHDLGEWHVWLKPHTVTITDQRKNMATGGPRVGLGHAEVSCCCLRCGQYWSTDNGMSYSSNSWLWVADNSRESYDKVIEAAKDTLRKRAERDNPCWGDVPPVPDKRHMVAMH